jgi:hypothetical protein
MLIKTSSKSVFTNVPDYAVSLSAGQFLKTTRSWLSQLFFLPDGAVSTPGVLLVLLAVVAAASWSSRKHMQFCAVLILILPLPANFITLRNFFVMYIPLLAWAVFIAALLVEVRDRLWRTPGAFWQFRQAGLFVLVALGLWAAQRADSFRSFDWIDPSQTALQSLRAGLQSCASVGRDGKVLLSADPFDKDDWAPVFATRLIFHSPEMVVDRVRPGSEKPPSEKYDCVLEYDQGSFRASLGN